MRLALDADLRISANGRVLALRGRVIRLSPAGPAALQALLTDTATPAQRRLGEHLLDAGMAHPRPRPRRVPTTTVIPVRDDAANLKALLEGSDPSTKRNRAEQGFLCEQGVEGSDPLVVDDGSRVPVAGAAVRREVSGGPGVARNAGLRLVRTELVAFLDSDTLPPEGWIEQLAGHFDDPRVAAVAPRVGEKLLDMGPRESAVGPGRPVPYVPAAALLVRRSALPAETFDPGLRFGEDVDLIWRLVAAGWRVRYDPRVVVGHARRRTLRRRFLYGTSAYPLSRRHRGLVRHIVLKPWPAATLALFAARRPRLAAVAYAAQTALLTRALHRKGAPVTVAPLWTAQALARTAAQFGKLASPYGAGLLYGRIAGKIRGLPTISDPSIYERTRRQPPAGSREHGAHDAVRRADQGALHA